MRTTPMRIKDHKMRITPTTANTDRATDKLTKLLEANKNARALRHQLASDRPPAWSKDHHRCYRIDLIHALDDFLEHLGATPPAALQVFPDLYKETTT